MGGVVCSGIGAALLGGISGEAECGAAEQATVSCGFTSGSAMVTERLPYHTLVMGRPAAAAVIVYYTVLAGGPDHEERMRRESRKGRRASGEKEEEEEQSKWGINRWIKIPPIGEKLFF